MRANDSHNFIDECDPASGIASLDLDQWLDELGRNGSQLTVARVRVDNIAEVARLGDAALNQAMARVRRNMIPSGALGICAMHDGDVMLAFLERGAAPQALSAFLEDAARLPVEVEGRVLTLDTRVGVSSPDRLSGPVERMERARMALSLTSSRTPVRFHGVRVEQEIGVRQVLADDLPALLTDHLHVMKQPVYDIRDHTVSGAELLMRVDHPELGLLAPDMVLPLLSNDLMWQLTVTMIRKAFAVSKTWNTVVSGTRLVSVNIPPSHLLHPDLLAIIDTTAAAEGVGTETLVLEVLETGLLATAPPAALRNGLRRRGVRIGIDDFGSGFSTLEQLATIDADVLKIDKQLVDGLTIDEPEKSAAAIAITIANNRDLVVVAEGVERREQLDGLRWLRCRYAQGFLLGRPMSLDRLLAIDR